MLSSSRMVFALATIVLLTIGMSQASWADEDDLRLAAGLRERRLFTQAEYVCRQALSGLEDSQTQGQQQAAFVIELIRIRSDQARFAVPGQRDSFRLAAQEVGQKFLNEYPQHSRRLIIRLQTVLIDSDLVNLIGQEQDFGVGSESDRKRALELSQNVRAKLRSIDQEITAQLQNARNASGNDPAALSVDELTNLQRNVQFQIALAGLRRADLYGKSSEKDSLNRASALADVLQKLDSLQRANEPGSNLWWQTQLALVKCHRQLGDNARAQTMLDRTRDGKLQRHRKKWHESILAEQAELLLASGLKNVTERRVAQSVLLAIDQRSVASARLDWLALRLVAGIHAVATTESQRAEHLSQAKRRVDLMARQHGPWWSARAKQLLSDAFQEAGQGGEVAEQYSEFVRQGQTAMDAGQFAEAAAAFEQAAKIAKRSNDVSAWRSCQINSSRASEQLGQHEVAAGKLLAAANEEPKHSAAASIHLRAIWNLAQAASGTANGKSLFTKALQEHLNLWPDSETADQARLWLGKKQLVGRQFAAASKTLLAVSKDSNHRPDAIRAAADALTNLTEGDVEKMLAALVEERPRDVVLLLAQARVSTRIGLDQGGERLNAPLGLWRGLARQLKPETDQWFEAKYNVARLLVASGEDKKARQLLGYLAALPSGWSKSSFAGQLTKLHAGLQASAAGK